MKSILDAMKTIILVGFLLAGMFGAAVALIVFALLS